MVVIDKRNAERKTIYKIGDRTFEVPELPIGRLKKLTTAAISYDLELDQSRQDDLATVLSDASTSKDEAALGNALVAMVGMIGDNTSGYIAHMLSALFQEDITETFVDDHLTIPDIRQIATQLQDDNQMEGVWDAVLAYVAPFCRARFGTASPSGNSNDEAEVALETED